LKPPKCMPPGGDKLQHNGTSWICGCADGWTGDDCETFEGIPEFQKTDVWFRSPFLSESSLLPDISTVSAYLSSMTTCSRDIHSVDYKNCPNPDSDWREARITFQKSFNFDTMLAKDCGLTSDDGKNYGVCMSWRCDDKVCGGGDPFYDKGKTMLIASEKFYRLEREYTYTWQIYLLGTAQFFLQSKTTKEVVKIITNPSDVTTYRPSWSSTYLRNAWVQFDIQETGDYRVIVSVKADEEEGAMFNVGSIEKQFMGSYDLSRFYWGYGRPAGYYSGCYVICPAGVGRNLNCNDVEYPPCDYQR